MPFINITKELDDRVQHFAEQLNKKREKKLEERHQKSGPNSIKQRYDGCVSELIVDHLLQSNYQNHILNIDGGGLVPDIIMGDQRWSVKSQSKWSQDRYGRGRFTFQDNDIALHLKGKK